MKGCNLMKLEELDVNVKCEQFQRDDCKLYSVREQPFSIHGLYQPLTQGTFRRMPLEVANQCNPSVKGLHTMTSGGRVRFQTDSEYIVLKAIYPSLFLVDCMPLTGSSGFDIYVDGVFYRKFGIPVVYSEDGTPSYDIDGGYEAIAQFPDRKMRDIIINFPLYNEVSDVYLGLQESAKLEKGKDYTYQTPIVFYGSSITTGGFASRPGNSYPAILSRELDSEFINLGFPGGAKGDLEIAKYITTLPMSVLVYDYDANAPNAEFLKETHEKMFLAIREKRPELPIVMLSYPGLVYAKKDIEDRKAVIRATYENAKARGDRNVYFIDGQEILSANERDVFFTDGNHPNDYGFLCMAKALYPLLKELLEQ
ncbi:MAG: hypothetical protein E7399_03865 [Ruminococcaceae bacterium]|nr:hypothetical protein [Oscillospiraceae bacterium]